MNANQSTTMYESVPVVSELNRVQGFDPLKFLRKTSKGERKLDLKYKKLWFRLKYPNGRIKLSSLKITEQLAIIEARVYFDKNDTQSKASFIAQREAKTTPGGLYIEAAQHAAIDEALSDAGFGVQFTSADPNRHIQAEPQAVSEQSIVEMTTEKQEPESVSVKEAIAKAVEVTVEEPIIEPPITQAVVNEAMAAETIVQKQPESIVEAPVAEVAQTTVPVAVETIKEVETVEPASESVAEPEGEEIEEDVPASGTDTPIYTANMPVEEICSMMTYDEACNVIVPLGTCKNWTMQQVAERRPASLKWYINGYTGEDNILRAAARLMQTGIDEMQKAS